MSNGNLCVIQGGACRAIQAAAGVLRAMDQLGIRIDRYHGSSAGAIVSGLHASGLSGSAIEELIRQTPVNQLFSLSWAQTAKMFIPGLTVDHLYDRTGMERFLSVHIDPAAVADKVLVSMTREDDKTLMVWATIQTILASSAIPELFPPVTIDGYEFVDGGVYNNIPTPAIADITSWDHIYIILCPDDPTPVSKGWTKLSRACHSFMATMDREIVQVRDEDRWNDLPNCTVLQPPPIKSNFLDWTDGLSQHAYEYALLAL